MVIYRHDQTPATARNYSPFTTPQPCGCADGACGLARGSGDRRGATQAGAVSGAARAGGPQAVAGPISYFGERVARTYAAIVGVSGGAACGARAFRVLALG